MREDAKMPKPRGKKPENFRATSEVEAETVVAKKGVDPVTALAALYQGEKTDASYIFNTAMVMMGVAVAYLFGAIPVMSNLMRDGPAEIVWAFLLLLPIPLWLIVAFHSLVTLNAMTHGISVRIIEDALFEASGLEVERDLVGSAASDKIMDIMQAKAIHILTTLVVYVGVVLLVVGFTVYALYSAKEVVEHDSILIHARVIEIATATYSLLAIMVALSWMVGLRMIDKGRKSSAEATPGSPETPGSDLAAGGREDEAPEPSARPAAAAGHRA
jgi:hypothetical protein